MVGLDPIVGTALGAAVSFYSLRATVFSSDVITSPSLILVAGLFLVLFFISSISLVLSSAYERRVRRIARFSLAFCVGASVGIAAADRPASMAYWGMEKNKVRSIVARVVSDPRMIKGGGLLADIEPKIAEGPMGLRTSASGKIAAVFSASSRENSPRAERDRLVRMTGRVVEGRFGPLFKAESVVVVREAGILEQSRSAFRRSILKRLDAVSWGGLAGALLLGSKDGLDSGENDAYVAAGCAHVLALSGMHLALISALLAFFLKPILGLKRATIAGFVVIVAYVYLAGAQASLVRAALMYAVAAVGIVFNFPRRVLCLLSIAFIVQLVLDPESAGGMSFVLSYLALAGLCFFTEAADDLSRAWIPDFLRTPLSASFGAFLATAAVSAAVFGMLRPVGLVASIILTPAANVLMIGGMAYLALSGLHPVLGVPIDTMLSVLGKANDAVVDTASRFPGFRTESALPVLIGSIAIAVLLVYGRILRNNTRNRFEPIS
ncbi:MAG: ComEC/Rec2 family competence protein [Treponemataceae bacterium]